MSLRNMARTGRDIAWTQRGIEAFGGGFLGLLLLKLTEKSEEALAKRQTGEEKSLDFFDRLLRRFDKFSWERRREKDDYVLTQGEFKRK